MATRDTIVDIAERQIGYKESKGNNNKFGKFFKANYTPWCGWFVAWVFRFCGINLQLYCDNVGYTPNLFEDLKRRGWSLPKNAGRKASIVFFDFPDNIHRIQHVGIIKAVLHDKYGNVTGYLTIEGNTGTSNQSNGGQVMIRTRSLSQVAGIIDLPFLGDEPVVQPRSTEAPKPTPAAEDQQKKLLELIFFVRQTMIGDGMENNGIAVATLQNLLNQSRLGIHLLVDGKWGQETKNGLIWYQASKGLAKDGICGPATWNRLLS